MVPLQQIFESLPALSETDLRELRSRISALLSIGGGSTRQESSADSTDYSQEDLILHPLRSVLHRINGTPMVHYPRNAPVRAMLRKHLPGLLAYIKTIDERDRAAFLEVALTMLADNIQQQNTVPLTAVTMVQQLPRLPAVIDEAFPGYHRAGTLNWIIRAYIEEKHGRS